MSVSTSQKAFILFFAPFYPVVVYKTIKHMLMFREWIFCYMYSVFGIQFLIIDQSCYKKRKYSLSVPTSQLL